MANSTKLNDVQLHLLKLFSKVSADELPNLKKVLVIFYNDLLQEELDRVWNEKGFSAEKMDSLLEEHPTRTPYPENKKQ
jgi:hypothetical protein